MDEPDGFAAWVSSKEFGLGATDGPDPKGNAKLFLCLQFYFKPSFIEGFLVTRCLSPHLSAKYCLVKLCYCFEIKN